MSKSRGDRHSVYSGLHKEPKRRVLALVPPDGEGTQRTRKLLHEHLESRASVEREYVNYAERLADVSGRHIPLFGIQFDWYPANGVGLAEVLERVPGAPSVRVLIPLTQLNHGVQSTVPVLSDHGVSHLLSISELQAAPGWRRDPVGTSATLKANRSLQSDAIVDLLLDISLFHSFPLFSAMSDARARAEVSKNKVKFAISRGLSTYFGPIDPEVPDYVSFASCVRRGTHFTRDDLRSINQLWIDFIEHSYSGDWAKPFNSDRQSLASHILKHNKRGGQISPTRLSRLLKALEPGPYILVLAASEPNNRKTSSKLQGLLGRSSWKSNYVTIFPHSHHSKFTEFYSSVQIFSFQVA